MKNLKNRLSILISIVIALVVVGAATYVLIHKDSEAPVVSKFEVRDIDDHSFHLSWQSYSNNAPVKFLIEFSNDNGVTWEISDLYCNQIDAMGTVEHPSEGANGLHGVNCRYGNNLTIILARITATDTRGLISTLSIPIDVRIKTVLSPDGMKAVFADSEGLKIKDIKTGTIQTIRKNVAPQNSYGTGIKNFYPRFWSPDSKYLLYSVSLYEGGIQGVLDIETGNYNETIFQFSPDSIFFIKLNGKDYLIYHTSNSNDIYGGEPGLYIAEVSSGPTIKILNLIQNKEIDIISSEYNESNGLIDFQFYRYDYKNETKTLYKGSVSMNGGTPTEEKIVTERLY